MAPARYVLDPYPSFNGLAVDPENNRVVMSDTNRKSVLIYDRAARGRAAEETPPLRQIRGPRTQVGFVAGVAVDPAAREVFAVNNDIEDSMAVFSYESEGNVQPLRLLAIPHRAWGISLGRSRKEIAIGVQTFGVVVYRREAQGVETPVRSIRGPNTAMADPHGVFLDDEHDEILAANHGNWNREQAHLAQLPAVDLTARPIQNPLGGKSLAPSITVYSGAAGGDVKPSRVIQGPRTQLDWPMGITVDTVHHEIVVANNGDNSILVFRRADQGDAEPVRVLRGGRTGIQRPMQVAVDTQHDELWVANFGDHNALVFPRLAAGNTPPRRVIRNAPLGAPTAGFGNPMAVAYDSKRDEILVPN